MLCEDSHHQHPEEEEEDVTLLGDKDDLQGKELKQALGANSSYDAYLLNDLGQVIASEPLSLPIN